MEKEKLKLMSGMRPTGKLHLGHYLGVLTNWVKLQDEYDCYFCVADWHSLTTKYNDTKDIRQNIVEVVLDWLACGINPEKSTIYLQSSVTQTAVLHLLLSMITPQNWVERDPTLKDMVKILKSRFNESEEGENISSEALHGISYGLMGYPVLQSADIMGFNASIVPVGHDQLAHLEITRDIIRRFNHLYKTDLFNESKPKLTHIPLLKGIDGQKMGKSYNNDIKISDDEKTTTDKIMRGITDKSRIRKDDPGHPDECLVIFHYYKAFADDNTIETVGAECSAGTRGCVDCKRQLCEIINKKFAPIREKRSEYAQNVDFVKNILTKGSKIAELEVEKVLHQVKEVMNLYI